MIDVGSIQTLVALFILGLGPGSGIYFVGRWALRGLDQVQAKLETLVQLHTDLRERVSLAEHRVGIVEGRLNAADLRLVQAESTLARCERREHG